MAYEERRERAQRSFAEGGCTNYPESSALPAGTISDGRVQDAKRRQATLMNCPHRLGKSCAP